MKSLMNILKLGLLVLVVAGLVMSGLALAQSESATEPAGLDAADERAIALLVELLTPLVDDGTITDTQAEAVAEHLATSVDGPRAAANRGRKLLAAVTNLLGIPPEQVILGLDEGATLAGIATANGSSGEALVAGLLHLYSGQIDARVTDEVLSPERAGELLAAAEARLEQYVFAPHEVSDRVADGARRRAARAEARASAKEAVLELLGMTSEELKASLPGTSLAGVAEAAGVTEDDLIAALTAPVAEALDTAVAADRLTREQADARLADATTRAEQRIAEVHPVHD